MQICEVCHTPFAWKQVSKSVALAYKPITCRTCKKRYHIRFSSRILASFLVVGPIGIFTFFFTFNKHAAVAVYCIPGTSY